MQQRSTTLTMPGDPNVNFNAQHSPMGAFMSFTCGNFGAGGGIGVEIGRPADQNVFVGVKDGNRKSSAPLRCLPFNRVAKATTGAADYQVEQAAGAVVDSKVQNYSAAQLSRRYGWAIDEWTTPDFTFAIHTPFSGIPDPATATSDSLRSALLPAVTATLRVDNRMGQETKTIVFALHFAKPGARVITDGPAVGFAWRRDMGVLARVEAENGEPGPRPFAFQRWSVFDGLADVNHVHSLGHTAGVAVEVPAGACCTLVLAIGVYLDGIVTTGLEGRYFYTRHYGSLDDVLSAALSRASELRELARSLDEQLSTSGLSADQQFLIAHATRSYYGSTQLLDVGGDPFWVVNEGEYCMMNTLDLSVDQVFWELERNPWVVRNLLDNFSSRYAYVDDLQDRGGRTFRGGLSFTHDMGVHNNFAPPGHSSYELAHLTGCFSYMTAEQLCNWVLIAACYVAMTGDDEWLKRNGSTIRACLDSLVVRGGDTGLVQLDSARCRGGQEITTYDSLDPSLAQTRNNAYMAVKCWASYVGLALMTDRLGDDVYAERAQDFACRAAAAVVAHVGPDGVIPAVFEPDNPGHASRILPAAEGLLYPAYWRRRDAARLDELLGDSSTTELVKALERHTRALLLDPARRNLFADGGIRLSSTSNNSWMSKIAIFQHVAREWFGADADPELAGVFAAADAAHVRWQTAGSTYWACSDQFVNGEAKGSRYYPRVVTAALWMNGVAVAPASLSGRPESLPKATVLGQI